MPLTLFKSIIKNNISNNYPLFFSISGLKLLKALENGVSQYPILEGRFPQVAGIVFGFDPSMPPYQRVDPELVKVQGQYLMLDRVIFTD